MRTRSSKGAPRCRKLAPGCGWEECRPTEAAQGQQGYQWARRSRYESRYGRINLSTLPRYKSGDGCDRTARDRAPGIFQEARSSESKNCTHLHFYTWAGWTDLFSRSGFRIESVEPTGIPVGLTLPRWDGTLPIRILERVFYTLVHLWKTLFAYQFVVVARRETIE